MPVDVINRASELVILVSWYDTCYSSFRRTGHQCRSSYGSRSSCMLPDPYPVGKLSVNSLSAARLSLQFLAALVASGICGAFNGFLVAKLNIQPMVATLILYTAGRGIAQLVTNGQITYIRVPSFQMRRWIYR